MLRVLIPGMADALAVNGFLLQPYYPLMIAGLATLLLTARIFENRLGSRS